MPWIAELAEALGIGVIVVPTLVEVLADDAPVGAETTQTDDALGRMASKHGDPKAATAAANDLAWKQTF